MSHAGLDKIKHIIFIVQENRSFDSYFGTYPGADGIPMSNGKPTVSVPDPSTGKCAFPYHSKDLIDSGGPHAASAYYSDLNRGKMNGFLAAAEYASSKYCLKNPDDPNCDLGHPDVMGYKTAQQIPNYWAYARNFVLQDHMFAPNISWSLPTHLAMVSGWSASCSDPNVATSCTSDLRFGGNGAYFAPGPVFAWTDITYLLDQAGVSWGYYVGDGTQPDCVDGQMYCPGQRLSPGTPSIWNPLPKFTDVINDGQVGNVQATSAFLSAARSGTLPSVSWVIPSGANSEHPPSSIAAGQAYVTNLVNHIMRGPDWSSSAIFLFWDDWGGFYDHVIPPVVNGEGYGFRVPGLLISPYARQGYIDPQVLSFDAYLKFVEDVFLGGQRLDPATDGRPDSRPYVAEAAPQLGDLVSEFDFNAAPRPPLILPPTP